VYLFELERTGFISVLHPCLGLLIFVEVSDLCFNKPFSFPRTEWQQVNTEDQIGMLTSIRWSRGSSVDIATDYGLGDRGSMPDRGTGFFF
jgi:hypothetical protein